MPLEKFTVKSQEAIEQAVEAATNRGHQQVDPLHLVLSLLRQRDGVASDLLEKLGIAAYPLIRKIESELDSLPKVHGQKSEMRFSHELTQVFRRAAAFVKMLHDTYISVEHLFIALSESCAVLKEFLERAGIDQGRLLEAIKEVRGSQQVTDQNPEDKFRPLEKYGRDLTELARRGKLDPVIGRDEEVRRLIQVLSRRTKNNPVLIGDPGVGKTAIVEGLAQRIAVEDVPEGLKSKKIIVLEIASLVAGAKFRGEFEDRLKAVLREIVAQQGSIIIFIDELHTIVGAGAAEGAIDASNMLKPALARGELRCIGATTLDEYRKHIEKDKALERRFQPVYIGEPSVEDTVAILRGLKERYEVHHGVRIKDSALIAAARLSQRYITERFLPDKAIDLIDEAASQIRIEIDSMPQELDEKKRRIMQIEVERQALKKERDRGSEERRKKLEEELKVLKQEAEELTQHWKLEKQAISQIRSIKEEIDSAKSEEAKAERGGDLGRVAEIRYGRLAELAKSLKEANERMGVLQKKRAMLREEVDEDDIVRIVSKWTGIPLTKLKEGQAQRLIDLEKHLAEKVVGQDEALKRVADCIRRSRVGLADQARPTGSFLFVGPTGVGKTELAKTLAIFLFGDANALIRIDMSEYMERHSVARLIGAPPGYVGYEEGGQLSEKVRRRPYSVVLFDEIEKAHPEVFGVLLQVLDDGRLTDGQGRVVNFKNTIVIMTSNIGTEFIKAGEDHERVEKDILDRLKGSLRPEFINRIDEIVIFRSLSEKDILRIIDIQLNELNRRLKEKQILLSFSEDAKILLSKEGFDPVYGARPLRRLIQKRVQDRLALGLLKGEFGPSDRIRVDAKGSDLVMRREEMK